VRVPTWCPFRLQVCCNGHSSLARQLSQRKMEYRRLDHAFGWVADLERAQKRTDHFCVEMVHRQLDEFADRYGPVIRPLVLSHHWSWDQVELATDGVLPSRPTGKPSMTVSPEPPCIPSNRTTSPFCWGASGTATTRTRGATGSTRASRGRVSNTPWGR
jgi:hypothetical protein